MRKITFDQSLSKKLETSIAMIGLAFYAGALTYLLQVAGFGSINTLIRYSVLLTALIGLCISRRDILSALKRGCWVWPITLLSLASFLWSVNPSITIQSLRSDFIPITIFAFYLAVRFSRKELFKMILTTVLSISIISIFFALFIPSIGRHPVDHIAYPGAWRGVFSHKNGFGVNLILTNVFLGLKFIDKRYRTSAFDLAAAILMVAGTLLSESLSALIISILTLFLTWMYSKRYRWKGKRTFLMLQISLMILTAIGAAISIFWVPLMTSLGKNPTLSGRTLIWEFVIQHRVAQEPLLGFGRAAFWKVPRLFVDVWRIAHHVPAHAHNGYVDLLADLGYVGLFTFILALIPLVISTLKLAYKSISVYDTWPLAFIIIFLIGNCTESLLLRGASFSWILFLAIACSDLSRNKLVNPGSKRVCVRGVRSRKV